MRVELCVIRHILYVFAVIAIFSVNAVVVSDDPAYINIDAEGGHTVTTSRNATNSSGIQSYCEMRHEGNRSSFCCFKGHMFGKCLPSFIIAGTQKSGTTALAAALSGHPQVSFAKRKELHFFDRKKQYSNGITHYLDSFRFWNFDADSTILPHFAEATPFYIASRHACRRISETVPEVKLIVLLREPVARAYSEYQMKKRRVDSQNDFITLIHQNVKQIYSCLLQYPFNWLDIASCAPEVLVKHEHWGKFSSAVSRLLGEGRKEGSTSDGLDAREGGSLENVKGEATSTGKPIRDWARMMQKCFAPTPESYWEKPKSPSSENKDFKHIDALNTSSLHNSSGVSTSPILADLEVPDVSTHPVQFSSLPPLESMIDMRSAPASFSSSLKISTLQDSFASNYKKAQWEQQWDWVGNIHALSEDDSHLFANSSSRDFKSRQRWRDKYFFQPLACLASHARETLTPLRIAFEDELHALKACAGGKFIHGTLEEMDEMLDACLTVHSGISNQYLYRSLYGVQIQHCLKFIPRANILFVASESLKNENSMLNAMLKIKNFLNISLFDSSREASVSMGNDERVVGNLKSNAMQEQVNERFPGFEQSSGWRLQSSYEPIPDNLRRKLSSFYRFQNRKLFDLIGEDYGELWS